MANTNDNEFKPELQASFLPGREITSAAAGRVAENHNFLISRSGHTIVDQTNGGYFTIATTTTWSPFGYYVVRLHPRGQDLRMRVTATSTFTNIQTRFILRGPGGITTTSNTGTFLNAWTTDIVNVGAGYYGDWCIVECQIRRTTSTSTETIRELVIDQPEITTNPLGSAGSRLVALDSGLWGTADAPLNAEQVGRAAAMTQTLRDENYRHVVNLSAWTNYTSTPAPTVSLGSTGKAGADARERIVAGMHMGLTGRRTYYIFATGRNASAGTATYSMAVQGYADPNYGFTISNSGNTVWGYGSWPEWAGEFKWSTRTSPTPWDMICEIAAANTAYLQSLTIIEGP